MSEKCIFSRKMSQKEFPEEEGKVIKEVDPEKEHSKTSATIAVGLIAEEAIILAAYYFTPEVYAQQEGDDIIIYMSKTNLGCCITGKSTKFQQESFVRHWNTQEENVHKKKGLEVEDVIKRLRDYQIEKKLDNSVKMLMGGWEKDKYNKSIPKLCALGPAGFFGQKKGYICIGHSALHCEDYLDAKVYEGMPVSEATIQVKKALQHVADIEGKKAGFVHVVTVYPNPRKKNKEEKFSVAQLHKDYHANPQYEHGSGSCGSGR